MNRRHKDVPTPGSGGALCSSSCCNMRRALEGHCCPRNSFSREGAALQWPQKCINCVFIDLTSPPSVL